MLDLFSGDGELSALMRAKNWSQTPLGPPEGWPQSLKTCVRIVLTSRQPMFVWWGEALINLYNDAYTAIVGGKHPEALGQPAAVVWREIWDQVGPRAGTAMRRNEGTYDEALLLIMERYGYPEETYYTFSYSPVPNDRGGTGGIICANTDDTQRIIGERQLALLRELGSRTAEARSVAKACRLAALCLETNSRDLPFALIYLLDPDKRRLVLAGCSGIAPGHFAAPEAADLDGTLIWPLAEVIRTNAARLVPDLDATLGVLPAGAWDQPPRQAIALPLAPQGETGRAGVLIAGLNPYRLYNEGYQGFLGLVAGQIAASIANAQAYEEERRRAEALAEIDRAKTAFFSNVSHEFRTPLTLMLAPLEDALNDHSPAALSTDQRERLDVVHRNSLRLLKLVNTLLDFSRIEAGRAQAGYQPTDLAALTADLASGFRSAVDKADLLLEIDCPPLPEPVYVDRDMWEKVVLNLLSNAFKFTFEGGITVRLRAEEGSAVLAVRDTGVGIPEHELPRLFERFHRIEGQTSRSFEGSGIGLALVQELIKLHGGVINARSKLGEGTVFTVAIPFGTAHLQADRIGARQITVSTTMRTEAFVEEALRWLPDMDAGGIETAFPASIFSAALSETINGQRPSVLLADDNADMRDYVRRLLGERYDVATAADGQAALDEISRRRPDLVLSDVMMPGLDGFELLRAIRSNPALRDMPVILLSARAGEEARAEGLDAGADDYLTKPFSARELLARVGANLTMARIRREAAEALRVRTAELETVLEAVPVGVWFTYDRDASRVHGNRAAARLLRMNETDNPSLSAPEAERPTHFRAFWNGTELAPEQLPLQRAARGEAVRGEEQEIRFGDGSSIVILTQALPIHDWEGRVAGAICVATDITERKQAEEQLRVLNETLETQVEERTRERDRLWELSEDLLVLADYEGHLLRVSPSWTRLLGHDEAFLLSVNYRSLAHPEDLGAVTASLAEMRASGRPVHLEDRLLAADGSWRWIAWVLSPDPSARYLHGVGRDVTEAKEREAALRSTEEALRQSQKMDAVGQLTGGIAHDFNNLLTGISGSLELLQTRLNQGRTAELGRHATAAMTSVTRASALTHRLLAFARRQALDPRSTNINKLIASMEELIRRTVGPPIQVETVFAGGLWPTLCDANQLENALLNLCINARDAMPEGGRLTIETANTHLDEAYVATQRDVRPGQYVSLSVTDTGTGMPPDVVARAFDPFFTTKPIGQGTGLGLSMLYGFVKQSEGHVRIYSEEGQGTTVRLYLPRHHDSAEPETDATGRIEVPRAETGEIVLVVEDEAVVRALILEVLAELGYGALEAADGPSGLRVLQSMARVDLLVTDVGLPGMNGRQLADAAREKRPNLKVLFITGYAHNAIIANGVLEAGMEMLAKPFALDTLATKIRTMIER